MARGVELLPDREARLAHMGAEDFDPDVIPVERVPEGVEPYNDAPGTAPRGQVAWIERAPLERTFRAQLDAPALVVLAYAWDRGWHATINGTPHPIERMAHALEGLWLPAGDHQVELRYRTRSFAVGAALCAIALPILFFLALPRRPAKRDMRPVKPLLSLLAAMLLVGCITSEREAPAPATVPEVVFSQPTEVWRVTQGIEPVGWLVRYTPSTDPADAFLSVRNPWQQEIGLIDAESRWWRFVPHEREPRLIGAGDTAEGVAAILELETKPQLVPAPLSELSG